MGDPSAQPDHAGRDTAPPHPRPGRLTLPSRPGTLTPARLKVTLVLDAAELVTLAAPEGKPAHHLRIRCTDRTVTAEISSKSLRKAQTAIREAGADNIALLLQAGSSPAT